MSFQNRKTFVNLKTEEVIPKWRDFTKWRSVPIWRDRSVEEDIKKLYHNGKTLVEMKTTSLMQMKKSYYIDTTSMLFVKW